MIKLYKTPSLLGAENVESISQIIDRKIEEYEGNTSKLIDYLGNAFNILQSRKNDVLIQKVESENELKRLNQFEADLKTNLAIYIKEHLGTDKLDDKLSLVSSSISVKEEQDEQEELKEVKLTESEMRTLLKANGLSDVKYETVKKEKVNASVTIRYRQGKKVNELKPKDAKEILENRKSLDFMD